MITGSVAATDTTNNDSLELQSTNSQIVKNASKTTNNLQSTNDITVNSNELNTDNKNINSSDSIKSSLSTANSTMTSKKSSTQITVYNITSTRGSTVTLKSVVTSNGNYVKNGTVVYKINSKTIGNTTVSNGGAKFVYTIPSTWTNINYTITAVYSENNIYARSTCNSTLKLKSNTTTSVSVKNITAISGETVTLKAVITTDEGEYAKVGKVAFKINGKTVGWANVSNGGAKINYTIPNNWKSKTYNITVVYGTNDYYKSSTSNGTLTVKNNINTKISINTTSVISGQTTTLISTITDTSGNPVKAGKVAFKINGKTIGLTNVTNGVSKLSYYIPSNWNGKYNITVVYGGYENYNSMTKTTTLNVIKETTKVSINTTSVTSGQIATFIATVTDSSGNKVSGGKAVFKINGVTIGNVNVTNGIAKLTYSIPSSWNGKYNISFVYGGYSQYLSCRKSATLTVTVKETKTSTGISVPDGYESYVKSTKNCNVSNSKIQSLAKSLTAGISDAYTAAVKIYNYVRDNITYKYYLNTKYGSVGTLNNKYGNCVDQTHLLIALLRASNIPARYCHAKCTFTSGLVIGHVWAEVYVNGKWYSCDTTSSRNSFNNIKNWYKSTSISRYTALSF